MDNKSIEMNLSRFLRKMNYININHIHMLNDEKITELSYICHKSHCIFFRVIYFRNNLFIASDVVGISLPTNYDNFHYNSNAKLKSEKSILKIKRKMQELNADSYYIVHSYYHLPLKVQENVDITMFFYENLSGFKGHLLINFQKYIWLYIKDDNVIISKEKKINNFNLSNFNISTQTFIINIMKKLQNSKKYSIMIITDKEMMPQMILDIPYFIKRKALNYLYYNNLNESTKILVTDNENAFIRFISLKIANKIILYKEIEGKLYIIEKRGEQYDE